MCNEATGLSVCPITAACPIFSLNSISSYFPGRGGSVCLGVRGGLSTSDQSRAASLIRKLIFFSRDLTIRFPHLTHVNLESCLWARATLKLRDVKAVWGLETRWWEDSRRNERTGEGWASGVLGFLLSKSLAIPPFLLFLPE